MKPVQKTIWIILFSIAMGYLESAVVVYLRALYYPDGFAFPLKEMASHILMTELFRESATLIMLMAVGWLSARERLHRFAWFLVVFGTWDMAYYLFLKLLLGWPESLLTNDILFLLPWIWTGPVLAPLINSATMLVLAAVILAARKDAKPVNSITRSEWMLLISGALIIFIAYIGDYAAFAAEYRHYLPQGAFSCKQFMMVLPGNFVPRSFNWLLFSAGVGLHLLAIMLIFRRRSRTEPFPGV